MVREQLATCYDSLEYSRSSTMAGIWNAIVYLANFEYQKGKVIETLEQIEKHMLSINNEAKITKTAGNALSIAGAVAAPFTLGVSLGVTLLGVAINISGSVGENKLMAYYIEIARKEIEELDDLATKINNLPINWDIVALELVKTAVDAGLLMSIRTLYPTTRKFLARIPPGIFLRILKDLKVKVASLVGNLAIKTGLSFTGAAPGYAIKAVKEVSSEIVKKTGKGVGKKLLVTSVLVSVSVAIDLYEIFRIWNADYPKTIKQVREAIKTLKYVENKVNNDDIST